MSRNLIVGWLTAAAVAWCAAAGAWAEPIPPQAESRTAAQVDIENFDQSSSVSVESVQIGFAGRYKVGSFTPLSIHLRSQSGSDQTGDLAVEMVDGDGVQVQLERQGLALASGKIESIRTLVKPGRPQGVLKLSFGEPSSAKAVHLADAHLPQALLATQELIVEVGKSIGMPLLERLYPQSDLARPSATLVENPALLPQDWLGYDGVDLVVVTTSDASVVDAWNSNTDAAASLDAWVTMGGKLMLCVGSQAPRALAAGSPLARFAPGRFRRVVESSPGPWETYAGAVAEPMQAADGGRAGPLPTAELVETRGEVELRDGETPLVVRAPHGLGEVLFVAIDLDAPPLANWSARLDLVLRLLGRTEPGSTGAAADNVNLQSVRLGYTDLAGQLRAALGQFDGVVMTPFWLVFLLALMYAAAIFPLEYLLARWIRPRFEAAWVLLPLVLLTSSAAVWYVAINWKGTETIVNQVEAVDVDCASGTIRGHLWIGVYSPRTDAYEISIAPVTEQPEWNRETRLSWLGLAGTGLGGMNSQLAKGDVFARGYSLENSALVDVPLTAWSSKTFEAAWRATTTSSTTGLVERAFDHKPLGTIQNETPLTLRDCVLFYEGWSYPLGTLEPQSTVDVGRVQRLLTVNSYLTGRRPVGEKEIATPYEPDGSNLLRILRAIAFHEAAGGRQYTSLTNRIYQRLDLSDQLRLGRAVLMASGRPVTRATATSADGSQAAPETPSAIYRFVIPVGRSRDGDDELPVMSLRWN